VTVTLTPAPAIFPWGGPNFAAAGRRRGGQGIVSLAVVSDYFRRASVEIDTLTGAVAPQPVPRWRGRV